ncbi:MAG: DUF4397 domain-containing protein [Deltaproteobacteria bacterium]|nr:DUF4397 domain-containing protein [Deltaproteobacteria bacterium]
MTRRICCSVLLLASGLLTLASCGGGGGGSGGSTARSARTGVRLLHGVLDIAPIELVDGSGAVKQVVKFADAPLYIDSATGPQNFEVLARERGPLFFSPIEVERNRHYTILTYGNLSSLGIGSAIFEDAAADQPLESGTANLRILHSLVGAASVEVSLGSGNIAPTSFGRASDYLSLPAGPVSAAILRSADQRVLATLSLILEEGRAYSIFLTGDLNYLTVARLLTDN